MAQRHSKATPGCPARDCEAGGPDRQHPLTPDELARIPDADRKAIESNAASPFRCEHCGCVYLRGDHYVTVAGFLDGSVLGKGWHKAHEA